jgi:hypothetical protein
MNKLLIALVAGTFAATVGAQTAETPKDKAKQSEVQQATQKGMEGSDVSAKKAGAAADKAKASKDAPKPAMTKADKQKEVAGATAGTTGAAATTAGAAADKDKMAKGTPKALPTKADKQTAVKDTTKKGMEGADVAAPAAGAAADKDKKK